MTDNSPTLRLGFAVDNLSQTLEDLKSLNSVAPRQPKATQWGRRAGDDDA